MLVEEEILVEQIAQQGAVVAQEAWVEPILEVPHPVMVALVKIIHLFMVLVSEIKVGLPGVVAEEEPLGTLLVTEMAGIQIMVVVEMGQMVKELMEQQTLAEEQGEVQMTLMERMEVLVLLLLGT